MNKKTTLLNGFLILCFAVLTADSFAQPPPNDDCAGAITLTPNITCVPTAGLVNGATASGFAVCAGFAEDDVWYKFVASSVTHNIRVVGLSIFDAVIEPFSGSCGGSSMGCTNAMGAGGTENVCLSGLTIGTTYWIRVYDANPVPTPGYNFTICVSDCGSVGEGELGINNEELEIYPNPSNGQFQLSVDGFQLSGIKIMNVLGETVLEQTTHNSQQINIDLSGEAKGIYFLHLSDDNKTTKKIIIQ